MADSAGQMWFDFRPKAQVSSESAATRRMISTEPLVEGRSELSGTPWAHLNRFPRTIHTIEKRMGFVNEEPGGPSLKAVIAEFVDLAQKECRMRDLTWYMGEFRLIGRKVADGRRLSLDQFALLYAMERMMHPPVGSEYLHDVLRRRGEPERHINRCISDLRMIYKKDEWP